MNDQHPHAGYAGYDSEATGSFDSDPLFGSLPGGHDGAYGSGYGAGQSGYSGQHDSTQWDTGAHPTTSYDAYTPYATQPQQQYEAAPTYETTATWTPVTDYGTDATTTAFAGIPAQGGAPDATGQWDTNGWHTNDQWATSDTAAYDTGAYDATAWNAGATPEHDQQTAQTAQVSYEAPPTHEAFEAQGAQKSHEAHGSCESYADLGSHDPYEPYRTDGTAGADTTEDADADADSAGVTYDAEIADVAPGSHRPLSRPATRNGGGSRSRRRSPAKRSALLTVAIPSACVMSVAGIAAASVGGLGGEDQKDDSKSTMAADDQGSVKPAAANNKLDTQLANLSADAENFADRASRTQERIDLRERQAAEKKKREEEAARKEALRPKFVMPVKQHGLSAYYGQAGVNWMSVHTGIDFPVMGGTPVMAATDGTVRTQLNSAYGNMAIVTMADGTETWYCHLSGTKIRSGPVKAGDVIAYSGDTGNSTGPHLHFEVRPGGGSAVDPLPWLRSHGVNPT
ncbi:M23 family metallopeptidase [Streptomyces sp. NBC_01591]|uniref:M23 family metallopeptidase n=1 Tax=Streptomyces sp. NBC_01591 TaxID=2975888 RepID=UPI002DDB6A72|nr:M23 family metallopeptidase [Streptomyces sp. NBC_01591]WSD70315.1 M23 family metallopeptidase [Streptomyces sp. NBC_01591]